MDKETARQLFHMLIGIVVIALLMVFSRTAMVFATFLIIIVGLLLVNLRLLGVSIPLVKWFEDSFERDDVIFPGWGSACYATGVLLTLTFLHNADQIAAVVFILAVGDGLSTLIGARGRIRLPYNPKKTLEGSAAFFVSALFSYYFIGPLAVPLALVAAVAETVPVIDDNISIPVACTAFLMFV